jgi:hypothetical protein
MLKSKCGRYIENKTFKWIFIVGKKQKNFLWNEKRSFWNVFIYKQKLNLKSTINTMILIMSLSSNFIFRSGIWSTLVLQSAEVWTFQSS